MPLFYPGKDFFILTLHTLRQPLDWLLISILTSQPIHKMCSGPPMKNHSFSIYEKTVNCKNSQKAPFGRWKGPLQISKWHCIKIVEPSCCKSTIYVSAPKWPITQTAIAQRPDPPPQKKCSISLHAVTDLCQFMAQNSKIWGVKKIWQLFDISKILKNRHFSAQQMANRWLIQISKPRCVECPRAHLWTDSWSNQWMPSTL